MRIDLSPVFVMLEPTNKAYLDALYEAKSEGISEWHEGNEFLFPYISTKKGYTGHLKEVYPKSKYIYIHADYEISADSLIKAYQSNEIAADSKYNEKRLVITGTVKSIEKLSSANSIVLTSANLTEEIQCKLKDANNTKEIEIGEKYTVVGLCKGV